jgi:hypothetical protein
MAIEIATYISDLSPANPTHTDGLNAADSHLRLIKATIQATFPNITGPVTGTQAALNAAAAAQPAGAGPLVVPAVSNSSTVSFAATSGAQGATIVSSGYTLTATITSASYSSTPAVYAHDNLGNYRVAGVQPSVSITGTNANGAQSIVMAPNPSGPGSTVGPAVTLTGLNSTLALTDPNGLITIGGTSVCFIGEIRLATSHWPAGWTQIGTLGGYTVIQRTT